MKEIEFRYESEIFKIVVEKSHSIYTFKLLDEKGNIAVIDDGVDKYQFNFNLQENLTSDYEFIEHEIYQSILDSVVEAIKNQVITARKHYYSINK